MVCRWPAPRPSASASITERASTTGGSESTDGSTAAQPHSAGRPPSRRSGTDAPQRVGRWRGFDSDGTGAPRAGPRLLALAQVAEDRLERVDDLVARCPALVEAESQVERLGRRPEREHVVLRAPGLRLRRRLAKLLARRAALAGDLFDEGSHFLGGLLPNYL